MIGIINYGLGNINAFSSILKNLGFKHQVISNQEELKTVSKIILPGVGAFDNAMELLNKSGMRELLDKMVIEDKIHVLGICVGMQILANESEEGNLKGLGWIDGKVKRFDPKNIIYKTKFPHMGWNTVKQKVSDEIFNSLDHHSRFYFLHSYFFECKDDSNTIATTEYGFDFSSVIKKNNIYGMQCHPEKSHNNGIQVLKNFGLL